MWEIEAFAAVRGFIETGGDVLLVIAFVTATMWTLILERLWYFRFGHREAVAKTQSFWNTRADHASWTAHKIRDLLVSRTELKLTDSLAFIRTLVAVCPMLGLLGTVTGMIEVFDVMATGGGNTRGMAAGVSKATLPTMAGMVAAISGMLFSTQLDQFAESQAAGIQDTLDIETEPAED
ncbi:MAG: MotA/TolQ/ExbB proton channel family protein [Myxococcota bacterium]|jgi:biopolymer transport protein ExbB|nr:MotA/TolQ/ExbB proton channel family protein [Myxococcota bacterium]